MGTASAESTEETYESVVAEINEKYDLGFELYSNGGMSVLEFKSWLTDIAITNARNREIANAGVVVNSGGPGIMPLSETDYYEGSDGTVKITCYITFDASGNILSVSSITGNAVFGLLHSNTFSMDANGYTISNSQKSVDVWVRGLMVYASNGMITGFVENSYHSCTFYS